MIPRVESQQQPVRLGVLTSGGDAQGMNAAVRAVVRTAIKCGAEPYAILEGFQGAVDGGDAIRRLDWDDVGSIQHRGGTIIGTARCTVFRERRGLLVAAKHLVERGIDRLVVIGGDGSLTGALELATEWPHLLGELVDAGDRAPETADAHPALLVCGLAGTIDNDIAELETTIGADSALHRIVDAIDALSSTAASHQRSFVIEVMGRHCGYLALMAAVAGGCDAVFVPEQPVGEEWRGELCAALRRGREAGRRDSMVIVAEGAADCAGGRIRAADIADAISQGLGEDARVTILGHVQRGGAPSAYDRCAGTILGYRAAMAAIEADPADAPIVLGICGNRVAALNLEQTLAATREISALVAEGEYGRSVAARGRTFERLLAVFRATAQPPITPPAGDAKRIAVMHAGGLAPGMNSAVRAAVRLGLAAGHTVLGVEGSFHGLIEGRVAELGWTDVDALADEGGAMLGTRREVPGGSDVEAVAAAIARERLDGLLLVGGMSAYRAADVLSAARAGLPGLQIPVVCVPASIDNNLPGSELSIGADTALCDAVGALDRIKQSASASRRCFVVELMGRKCGYLTAMAGLAAGAERVYLHEEGITLDGLQHDVARMRQSFREGRRMYLAVRNEQADELYTTDVLARLFAKESEGLYDVRSEVIGHVQQGGDPTPFDRVLATRLVDRALQDLQEKFAAGSAGWQYVGLTSTGLQIAPIASMQALIDPDAGRPREQWWMGLGDVKAAVAEPPRD